MMMKYLQTMIVMMVTAMAYTHQPEVTVQRDSDYVEITGVTSFQLRCPSKGLYSFNVKLSDDDAYVAKGCDTIFVKEGDTLWIKGYDQTIHVKWTKE